MLQTDKDKILERTNGGLTVFTHYLGEGCLAKKFCNPFRDDKHPSCRLYENKNSDGLITYYMYDFARSEYSGDCFWMVAKMLNVDLARDFKAILETIDHDLCLCVFESNDKAMRQDVDYKARMLRKYHRMEESSIKSFTLERKSFTREELSYWSKYGIAEDTLRRFKVSSVKNCTFLKANDKSFTVFGSKDIPMFAYEFGDSDGFKFYRPKAKSRFLYAGNLPKPYVFGWEQLPETGKVVFITGGEKDVMSLAAHGFHAIAFNSETASIPEEKMQSLSKRFEKVMFLYDSDDTGKAESLKNLEKYKGKYNVSRLVLPLNGTKAEKDISDFFATGHDGQDLEFLITKSQETPNSAK